MDLTEAEDIKKTWQEYTEELYKKKIFMIQITMMVCDHSPRARSLECQVNWTLGSITMNKASGGDGISAELFQILKDDAVKVLHSICQQIWKIRQWPQDWKSSGFIPKKSNAKECSNYCTTALISYFSKVMFKFLQARLQQYLTVNFQMFKLVLEKAKEPEIKLPTSAGSLKKQGSARKTPTSVLLTTPRLLTVWIITNCGKFLKRWEYETTDLPPEKSVCRSGSNS